MRHPLRGRFSTSSASNRKNRASFKRDVCDRKPRYVQRRPDGKKSVPPAPRRASTAPSGHWKPLYGRAHNS